MDPFSSRRLVAVALGLVLIALPACSSDSASDESVAAELEPEAAAVLDAYFEAWNNTDPDAFLETVNPAVYQYVFSGTSFSADVMAGRLPLHADDNLSLERFEQIEVKLAATTQDLYYVAVTAERTDDEIGGTVNGIIVFEIAYYPDRGWLVALHHNFGM